MRPEIPEHLRFPLSVRRVKVQHVTFEWSRSNSVVLAARACRLCHGSGLRKARDGVTINPCKCVQRAIFRICFGRYTQCSTQDRHLSQVRLGNWYAGCRAQPWTWGRREEEFLADFVLVSRRVLTRREYLLLKLHHLRGLDWRACCPKLRVNRGDFFHLVYRVEEKLGRVFAELQPYGLFPPDEYFGGTTWKSPGQGTGDSEQGARGQGPGASEDADRVAEKAMAVGSMAA